MTRTPGDALQRAVLAEIIASAGVRDLMGARFYDQVPEDATLPYGNFGEHQAVENGADGIDDAETHYLTLHVWSEKPGAVECKTICAAIKQAINRRVVAVDGQGSVELRCPSYRTFIDADGITTHGVVTVEADIDG